MEVLGAGLQCGDAGVEQRWLARNFLRSLVQNCYAWLPG